MSAADPEVKTSPEPQEKKEPSQHHDSHDEEYESADDAYEEEIVEEIEVEEEVEEEEEEEEDPERTPSQQDKELDDDEDVKNPQFIPKRGYFYEHDDRTKEEEGEKEEEKGVVKKEEKKTPGKEPDRWSHDLYNENDQTPKSKDELSRAYGYDIFTEDQAPRARRRRRYGRGPNKYTRQWEDEEAYQKPRGGFRGRGGRGRGNFRGTDRRSNDQDEVEEEFPPLPSSAPKSSTQPQQASKPQVKDFPQDRNFGNRNREGNFEQQQQQHRPPPSHENRRRYENEFDRGRGYRGGGQGGRGGGNGRGRRNEFSNTNRNRYRDQYDEEDNRRENIQENSQGADKFNKPRPAQGVSVSSEKENRKQYQQANGHPKDRDTRPKEIPIPSSKPPFTNTEYTGSHSLTANRGGKQYQGQQMYHQEDHRQGQAGQSNILAEKGVTDLRDVLNAKRQQQQQQHQSQPERRPQQKLQPQPIPNIQHQQQQQIPSHSHSPQMQAQQQHHSMQMQPPPQMEQQMSTSGKPKRFSTQRQRQGEPPLVNQAVPVGVGPPMGGGMPHSVGPPLGHVPNMIPVVSGAEQMVPSSVPVYPQAPGYYDGPQGYESSGSPVTVATVATNGSSVSPSLWAPHAFTNAPYPSPPTGPQVPSAQYADHPAYLAAQQTGSIYPANPQFIQDPGLMNYNATGPPPFAPPYHPQGYQGYPPVQNPAPLPELYHGGLTYYNPQPQIHRQPIMAAPKRTKTVLQLVEPPEKSKGERSGGQFREMVHQQHDGQHSQSQSQSPPIVAYQPDTNVHGHVEPSELTEQFEKVSIAEMELQPAPQEARKPSPLPEQESWSAQMEEVGSPIGDCPDTSIIPEVSKSTDFENTKEARDPRPSGSPQPQKQHKELDTTEAPKDRSTPEN